MFENLKLRLFVQILTRHFLWLWLKRVIHNFDKTVSFMFEQGDLFAVFLIFLLVIISLRRQKEQNPAGYIVKTLSLFCFCSTHTVVFSVNGILSKQSHCWVFKKLISPKSYWQNTQNYAMIGVGRRPGIIFCLLFCLFVCESRLKKQIMN